MSKSWYLLANGQPEDRAVYYTGQQAFHGGELWGNVNDAKRFDTLEEVFDRIRKEGCTASPIIVEIYEVTWDIIVTGFEDCMRGEQTDARKVYHRYNTVSYITNSEGR